RGNPECLQCDVGLLPARTATEVVPRDDDVPGLHLLRPRRVHSLERVLREDLGVRRPEVLPRDDVVRGDVVPERPHAALEAGLHRCWEGKPRDKHGEVTYMYPIRP